MSERMERRRNFYAWFIFAIFAFTYMQVTVHRQGVSTLALDMMQDLAVGGGSMALISSGYYYAYGAVQIPAGILADRWGGRNTIASFLLLGAAGSVFMGLATSVDVAVLCRIMVGVGMGMVYVPAVRVLLAWFPRERHSLITGLLLSAGPSGMMLATTPLVFFSDAWGWRNALIGVGIVTVITSFCIWILVRDTPQKEVKEKSVAQLPLKEAIRSILKDRLYLSCVIYFFCTPAFFYSFTGLWSCPYFIQGYGLSPTVTGNIMLCFALGGAVTPPLVAAITEYFQFSKRHMLILSSLCTAVLSLPLICPFKILPTGVIPVWGIVLGCFSAGFAALCLSFIQEHFPRNLVGTAMGLTNISLFAGVTVMQIVSGYTMDLLASVESEYQISHYAMIFVLYVSLQFIALITMFRCPKSNTELGRFDR